MKYMEITAFHGNPLKCMEMHIFHGMYVIPLNPWKSSNPWKSDGIHGNQCIPWKSIEMHGNANIPWNVCNSIKSMEIH